MPGEAYVQHILGLLNSISVRGSEDITRMMNAIYMLESLKKDIIEHKQNEQEEAKTEENV